MKSSIDWHNLKVLITNKSSFELELLIDISPEFDVTFVKPTGIIKIEGCGLSKYTERANLQSTRKCN